LSGNERFGGTVEDVRHVEQDDGEFKGLVGGKNRGGLPPRISRKFRRRRSASIHAPQHGLAIPRRHRGIASVGF
jgi:hypothetical protein